MTAVRYYLLGNDEKVLGRLADYYEYLDPAGKWIAHPEVADLVVMGCVWKLPAELPFAFPGWAREITEQEAKEFIKEFSKAEAVAALTAATS